MVKTLFLLFVFLLVKIGDGVEWILGEIQHVLIYIIRLIRKAIHWIQRNKTKQKKNVHLNTVQVHTGYVPFVKSSWSQWPQFPQMLLRHAFRYKNRRKKRSLKKEVSRYKTSFFYKLKFIFFGILFSCLFIFIPLLVFIFISDLPSPNNLSVTYIPKTTKIFDRNGTPLYEIYANQNRTIVKLSDIPRLLQQATIAIEDKDFYTHPGFDIRGILRAFFSDVDNKGLQGGSTITQQLVKSAFLNPEPTIIRKIREVVLAFWAERIYSKNQILELYFNYVPYGGTAWGVESASEVYFNKHVKDLDLAESAFLAGLPQAPTQYSPYSNESGEHLWKTRQKEVLDAMVRQRYISQSQATQAYQEQLIFQPPQVPLRAPHFVMYVKDLLEQKYGASEVEQGGLQVTTSLDLPLEDSVQSIVSTEISQDQGLAISNGAALVTNPQNGDILAMIGSVNYFDTEHDGNVNLTTALRQPGSTIKLVTYSLALSNGFTEETPIDDSPLTINLAGETYTPVNYDGRFHGRLPLRMVLGNSLNIPAVRVAQRFGVPAIVQQGQKLGISSWKDASQYGISITLGGADTTMMDLATAYGTIANGGAREDLDPILEVKDANGNILYQKSPVSQPVLDPGVAYILTDILSDNNNRAIEFGPNTPLVIPGHKVAVKTGTTDEKRDNWTIGFTPNILVATWVGNNDNSPMSQTLASGITGAAPIWNKIMTSLLNSKTDTPLSIPSDILVKQCNGRMDFFIRGTESSINCSFQPSPSPTNKP